MFIVYFLIMRTLAYKGFNMDEAILFREIMWQTIVTQSALAN